MLGCMVHRWVKTCKKRGVSTTASEALFVKNGVTCWIKTGSFFHTEKRLQGGPLGPDKVKTCKTQILCWVTRWVETCKKRGGTQKES